MTEHRKHTGRKKRKIGLVVTGGLFAALIIVLAVFFLWGQNSGGKKQYEAQIKQEAQEFTDGLISELEQIDTSDQGLDAENQEGAGSAPAEVPEEVITEAEKQVIAEELAKLEDERKQQVLKTLSVAYSKALDEQKKESFNLVEKLIADGKADWKALAAKGENTAANKGLLASEYLAKSKVLEQQMDASFQSLIAKMNEQLNAEGIDPEAMIAQYQAEYKKIKEENRAALMEKVLAAVNK